ncbi:uncharacterized protein LOC135928282 isoform X1 [Gordionus sp. m RMFG-2023]|uniref:uncharacterized protein LOC135928282 isoform X1 n=2 Tax=Gordionus sp. m RMFG-2023 TaxID=3053472 RepID=UPI0031FE071A
MRDAVSSPSDYFFQGTKKNEDLNGEGQLDEIEKSVASEDLDYNKQITYQTYPLKNLTPSIRTVSEEPPGVSELPDFDNSIAYVNRELLQEIGSGASLCIIGTNSGCSSHEECVIRAGIEVCECLKTYGRRHRQRYAPCQPIKYTFVVEIVLEHPFREEYLDQSSTAFFSLTDALLTLLEFTILANPTLDSLVIATRVIDLRPGSTIATVVVYLNDKATVNPVTQKFLWDELHKNIPSNDIRFGANSLNYIKAISLCDRAETNPCSQNADCSIKNRYEFGGCKCKRGYRDVSPINSYNGSVCIKFSGECDIELNTGCGPEEVCIMTHDKSACVCQPPYIKNVITRECQVMGSCNPHINSGCGFNEVCQPQGMGAICICSPGYTRNFFKGYCQIMQGDQCDVHSQRGCKRYAKEKCIIINGRGVCACRHGYYLDVDTNSCQKDYSECDPLTEESCSDGERCVYNHKITVCECLPGYFRNPITQTCISDVLTVRVRIHLFLVYVPGLENIYSPSFQYLQNSLLEAFWYFVSQDSDLNECILDIAVFNFLPGSIIAETRFVLKPQGNVSANYIKRSIQNAIIPQEPMFQSLRFKDAMIEAEEESPCSDHKLNYCGPNAYCFLIGSTYKCKCLAGYRDVSLPRNSKQRCELVCLDEHCAYNGKCYWEGQSKACGCHFGYYGKRCHVNGIPILVTLTVSVILFIIFALIMVTKKNSDKYQRGKDHIKRYLKEKQRILNKKDISDESRDGEICKNGYRNLSLTSGKQNLVESMLYVGLIDSFVTLSTNSNSDPNRSSCLSPIGDRYKRNGSLLKIITRKSYRLAKKGADYIQWLHHSPSTITEESNSLYAKEANCKSLIIKTRENVGNVSSGSSNLDSIYSSEDLDIALYNRNFLADKNNIHQNAQKVTSSKSSNLSHNAVKRNDFHANREYSLYR